MGFFCTVWGQQLDSLRGNSGKGAFSSNYIYWSFITAWSPWCHVQPQLSLLTFGILCLWSLGTVVPKQWGHFMAHLPKPWSHQQQAQLQCQVGCPHYSYQEGKEFPCVPVHEKEHWRGLACLFICVSPENWISSVAAVPCCWKNGCWGGPKLHSCSTSKVSLELETSCILTVFQFPV